METAGDGLGPSAPIEAAHIEHNQHRIRAGLHRLLPSIVEAPLISTGYTVNPGDVLVTRKGKFKVDSVFRSAEGIRHAFSDLPLPGEKE